MVLTNFTQLVDRVRARPTTARVALAAAHDEHSLEAVLRARSEGLVAPVLVGNAAMIHAMLDKLGASVPEEDVLNEPEANAAAARSVALVRAGQADFLMKGKLQTGELLRAVVHKESGLGTGGVMSHMSVHELARYHKLLVTTDGGMLLYPTLEQKKALIENAVGVLHTLGYDEPKVAVLAAIETLNPKMPETLDAVALKEMNETGALTGCLIEGPISLDLSLVKERSADKNYSSPVAGDADILVAPNIAAGNILGKALVEMAGATMAGIVVGARAPIILASRGSSSEEKYLSIVLAAAAAQ